MYIYVAHNLLIYTISNFFAQNGIAKQFGNYTTSLSILEIWAGTCIPGTYSRSSIYTELWKLISSQL